MTQGCGTPCEYALLQAPLAFTLRSPLCLCHILQLLFPPAYYLDRSSNSPPPPLSPACLFHTYPPTKSSREHNVRTARQPTVKRRRTPTATAPVL